MWSPPQVVDIPGCCGVDHADDGVALTLEEDPPRVDLIAGEAFRIVVSVEVEDLQRNLSYDAFPLE